METKEEVLKLLKENNEPMKSGEIAEKLGVDKKEVDKIIKKLKDSGKIISPKRCYYSIKN
jgi:Mn-dependent DtxR family transcriptional regulator